MPDIHQLTHLIRLLEDESDIVRRSVMNALVDFGPELHEALDGLADPPSAHERRRILALVDAWPNRLQEGAVQAEEGGLTRFEAGQLVRHVRYGYRGVIVDMDLTCQADDAWYNRNATRPARNQPWYHVLVHGSAGVTYAAQVSLTEDPSTEEILHPYITLFFSEYARGRYTRNDRPWPGSGRKP